MPAAPRSVAVRPHATAGQDSEGRDRAAQGPRDSARSVGTRHHRGAGVNRVVTFFKTIFLVDLLKGLWVTLKYTPQPAFTFQYPAERRPTAPRFRGVLRLQTEPGTGAQTCIVCDQCAKACPDDLIALGGHREPGTKIKVLDYFDFNLSRCSFCGLCAEVCPTKPIKALIMSEDYELGSYSRETQILRVDQMYDGVAIEQYTR
ncbi:MAG: NADH-quinone oxidoreductase subunit I [Acidobacteria bacterium]|nr:MAG: NADH-quinone oxidoreductase subunit I [Acidobacteriota bacterium]